MTAGDKNPHKSHCHEKRRSNKPLMEKRRRARINQSLSILKSIILQDTASLDQRPNCKGNTAQSRLEKADILELTVTHLRYLEKRRLEQQLTSDVPNVESSYRNGYEACLRDIRNYLQSRSTDERLTLAKQDLLLHLQAKMSSQPLSSDSMDDDPSHDVNVTPTRLPDGRLALIFPPTSAWLSVQHTDNSSSVRPDDVTPPCSPSSSSAVATSMDKTSDGVVWRPW